ncbi:MAG: hypothetical protein IH959_05280 [Chloroflexi bacterium]|nr:hypothetical protein [Chloroflexota bacterium]
MVEESRSEVAVEGVGWAQDQLYQLKAQVGQLEQQFDQLQSTATATAEQLRQMEATLREAALGAAQAFRLQEELNQTVALVVQVHDQQAEAKERLDVLTRQRHGDESRDQQDWTDVAKRVEQIERQVEQWHERQAGVDEVGRRFQEGLSLIHQQLQQIEQRLEASEGKGARGLEGANRAEHTLTQQAAAIEDLQREDETLAERTRATAEVARRLETTVSEQLQGMQRLEILAERIELHRAERQRLEDRALRLEEELGELRGRAEQQEQQQGRLSAQEQGLASRLEALQEQVTEQRSVLVEQIRKLTTTQTRTKHRQIQETEREIREMKQYVADLTNE